MEEDWNEGLLDESDYDDFSFKRNRKRSIDDENIAKKKIQSDDVHYGNNTFNKRKAIRQLPVQEGHSTWSLEDDTFFYPMGICNHGIDGAHKSVIITWSEYSVINFVIKKMVNKKQTKTMRVRLNVPKEEKIRDIIILDFNTLLLFESGCVNYFSSAKSMHYLQWLNGVRSIGKTLDGFCVIRLTPDQRISLELFEDAVNMGKMDVEPKKRYDITFDESNIFNCNLEDENFLIFAITVEEENKEFLKQLINAQDLNSANEIFVFAISGNVFVLIPDSVNNDHYNIEIIFSYASNVKFIKIDQKQKMCFIYLECGNVDIWYYSTVTNKFLHQTDYTGAGCLNYTYSDSRRSFFFVDELHIVEARFNFDLTNENFSVKKTYKSISGVLACTWVESINQLICLDCNNIFHQLEFENLAIEDDQYGSTRNTDTSLSTHIVGDCENFDCLVELTPEHVLKLNEKASIIQQLKDLPKEMYTAIEKEYVKQELLTIYNRRNDYGKQITAHIKFSKHLCTDSKIDFAHVGTSTNSFCGSGELKAIIKLAIACKDIFKNSVWRLYVKCGDSVYTLSLPRTLMDDEICLLIPIKRTIQELIPSIQLYLYTFIFQATEYIPLSIPINLLETSKTYEDLIMTTSNPAQNRYWNYSLNDLFTKFKKHINQTESPNFEYCFAVSKNIDFNAIIDILKLSCHLMPCDNVCEIFAFNSKVTISFEKSKGVLHLKSDHAEALYYVKLYLFLASTEKQLDGVHLFKDDHQMIMRHQCSVESCYQSLQENGINGTLSASEMKSWQDALVQTYEKMRKHIISKQ